MGTSVQLQAILPRIFQSSISQVLAMKTACGFIIAFSHITTSIHRHCTFEEMRRGPTVKMQVAHKNSSESGRPILPIMMSFCNVQLPHSDVLSASLQTQIVWRMLRNHDQRGRLVPRQKIIPRMIYPSQADQQLLKILHDITRRAQFGGSRWLGANHQALLGMARISVILGEEHFHGRKNQQ